MTKPTVDTCSVSDLLAVDPRDVWRDLRLLFTVVCALFGVMALGGLAGFTMDARERRAVVALMQTPALGFSEEDGAWLWRFSLNPLDEEIDKPTGTAVALSMLLGVPLARLRLALPDEMLSWSTATAMGRRFALSKEGFANTVDTQRAMVPALLWGAPAPTQKRIPTHYMVDDEAPPRKEDPSTEAMNELMDTFVGTALVLAFLAVAQLVPGVELARRKSAAKRHFAGVTTPAGWDFDKLSTDFMTMLRCACLAGFYEQRACTN
jgi:hypothetical protein